MTWLKFNNIYQDQVLNSYINFKPYPIAKYMIAYFPACFPFMLKMLRLSYPTSSFETYLQSPSHHIICQLKTLPRKVRSPSHNRRWRNIFIKFNILDSFKEKLCNLCRFFTASSNKHDCYFSFSSSPISPILSPINQAYYISFPHV